MSIAHAKVLCLYRVGTQEECGHSVRNGIHATTYTRFQIKINFLVDMALHENSLCHFVVFLTAYYFLCILQQCGI